MGIKDKGGDYYKAQLCLPAEETVSLASGLKAIHTPKGLMSVATNMLCLQRYKLSSGAHLSEAFVLGFEPRP